MIRDLTFEEMAAVLRRNTFGRLGCSSDGKPYVIPLSYIYSPNAIYGQTSEGMKLDFIRKNPLVCFQVDEVYEGHPWRSVILWGTFEELRVEDAENPEVAEAVSVISGGLKDIQKIAGVDVPISTEGRPRQLLVNGKKAVLFRIVIREITGRCSEM